MFGRSVKSFEKKWLKDYKKNPEGALWDAYISLKNKKNIPKEKRVILLSLLRNGRIDNDNRYAKWIANLPHEALHLELSERIEVINILDKILERNADKFWLLVSGFIGDVNITSLEERSLFIDILERTLVSNSKHAVSEANEIIKSKKSNLNVEEKSRVFRVSKNRQREMELEKSREIVRGLERDLYSNPDVMFTNIKKLCDDNIFDSLSDDDQYKVLRMILRSYHDDANKVGVLSTAGSVLEKGLGINNEGRGILIYFIDSLSKTLPDLGFMWACNALNKTRLLEKHHKGKLETIATSLLDHRDDEARNNIIETCAKFIANNGSFKNEKVNKAFARAVLKDRANSALQNNRPTANQNNKPKPRNP